MKLPLPPGFYKLPVDERRALLLGDEVARSAPVLDEGGLDTARADKIVENVLGIYALPFGVALGIRLNGEERLAPMVVEEPSVVAAASNASKMMSAGTGVLAEMVDPRMIAQIELRRVPDVARATSSILGERPALLAAANDAVGNLVRRGGGARDIEVREIGPGHLVVHLLVDVQDAMGANLVNTAAEAIGGRVAELASAELGLRILSNLADRRLVRARVEVPGEALVGKLRLSPSDVLDGIEAASVFSERDPYRAATHNKGIMNGIDSVVIATGNDYRAVEAGAHAYAARGGRYTALATWRRRGDVLEGSLELPLALGTVGGTLRVHEGAQLALRLAEVRGATDLALLAAAVGLASNLAAIRALSTEGIQKGHMALHARSVAVAAGAAPHEVDAIAALLVERGTIDLASAESLLSERRAK